ncbi:RNHCP domain-containing protein [Frankia sp. EI5c]|uniref:RNHCP domain-containing protein n=1 Tax=Frankia sp. EI5c TaxID=683316 RepID=UPI0037BED15A
MQPREDGTGETVPGETVPGETVPAEGGRRSARRFARTPEDFECLVCGTAVRGDGYTNHCPACLWSRHVDVHPGDRAAACRGLMRPVAVEVGAWETVLTHHCEGCGHRRRNRTSPADAEAALFALAARVAEDVSRGGAPGLGEPGLGGPALRGRGPVSGAPRRRGRRR